MIFIISLGKIAFIFFFTINTFFPIGAHNFGSESDPNNTIFLVLFFYYIDKLNA